jgi:hypothetical protein
VQFVKDPENHSESTDIDVQTVEEEQNEKDTEAFYKYYWRLKNMSVAGRSKTDMHVAPNLFSKSIALDKLSVKPSQINLYYPESFAVQIPEKKPKHNQLQPLLLRSPPLMSTQKLEGLNTKNLVRHQPSQIHYFTNAETT